MQVMKMALECLQQEGVCVKTQIFVGNSKGWEIINIFFYLTSLMREFEALLGYADHKRDIYDNRWNGGGKMGEYK